MNETDDLRRLLEDAVDDVEPRDALDSIHARTKVSSLSSRRSWTLSAAAAVVATAATVLAVVVAGDGTTGGGDAVGPATSASPTTAATSTATPPPTPSSGPTTPTAHAAATAAVPVYYPGETTRGTRLYREFHRLEVPGDDVVTAAVNEAVAGAPLDPDYRTDWPAATAASRVDRPATPDVITIDVSGPSLRGRPAGMSQEDAQIAVQQLVYTAQAAAQSRRPVQLLLNSRRTDTLLGVPVAEPLAQADPADVLAQVWVIDPAEGARVTSPFEVRGLAAAFEATVVWELRSAGRVVADGVTTAEECCTMAPYSFQVDAPPGEYTLVVQDTDPSGGEGPGVWEDTRQLTVVR